MAVDTKAPNDTVADALRRRAAAIDKHDPHTAALLRMGADTICNLVATRNELDGEIARLTTQRNTAYGYGSDAGAPPWML